jgi:hypothetical protein
LSNHPPPNINAADTIAPPNAAPTTSGTPSIVLEEEEGLEEEAGSPLLVGDDEGEAVGLELAAAVADADALADAVAVADAVALADAVAVALAVEVGDDDAGVGDGGGEPVREKMYTMPMFDCPPCRSATNAYSPPEETATRDIELREAPIGSVANCSLSPDALKEYTPTFVFGPSSASTV